MDTSGTPPVYNTVLRGCNMSPKPGRLLLDEAEIGQAFTLVRDRDNEYDAYAVKVMLPDPNGIERHFVGFIHRDTAMEVGQWIDVGWYFTCTMTERDDVTKKREHGLCLVPAEKGEAYAPPEPVPADDDISF